MRPLIIGLCGRAGSGKTSAARFIEERYKATRLSFAAPLKALAMELWDFSEEQVYGEADVKEAIDPRWGISPRTAMQRLGEGTRRHLYDGIWIEAVLQKIGRQRGIFVIEDLRYLNEAEKISAIGYVFRLHCEDSISTDVGTHPSEAQVDQIPVSQIHAELHGSRRQGLDHLFGLITAQLDDLLSR
jgi:hypothetical protein